MSEEQSLFIRKRLDESFKKADDENDTHFKMPEGEEQAEEEDEGRLIFDPDRDEYVHSITGDVFNKEKNPAIYKKPSPAANPRTPAGTEDAAIEWMAKRAAYKRLGLGEVKIPDKYSSFDFEKHVQEDPTFMWRYRDVYDKIYNDLKNEQAQGQAAAEDKAEQDLSDFADAWDAMMGSIGSKDEEKILTGIEGDYDNAVIKDIRDLIRTRSDYPTNIFDFDDFVEKVEDLVAEGGPEALREIAKLADNARVSQRSWDQTGNRIEEALSNAIDPELGNWIRQQNDERNRADTMKVSDSKLKGVRGQGGSPLVEETAKKKGGSKKLVNISGDDLTMGVPINNSILPLSFGEYEIPMYDEASGKTVPYRIVPSGAAKSSLVMGLLAGLGAWGDLGADEITSNIGKHILSQMGGPLFHRISMPRSTDGAGYSEKLRDSYLRELAHRAGYDMGGLLEENGMLTRADDLIDLENRNYAPFLDTVDTAILPVLADYYDKWKGTDHYGNFVNASRSDYKSRKKSKSPSVGARSGEVSIGPAYSSAASKFRKELMNTVKKEFNGDWEAFINAIAPNDDLGLRDGIMNTLFSGAYKRDKDKYGMFVPKSLTDTAKEWRAKSHNVMPPRLDDYAAKTEDVPGRIFEALMPSIPEMSEEIINGRLRDYTYGSKDTPEQYEYMVKPIRDMVAKIASGNGSELTPRERNYLMTVGFSPERLLAHKLGSNERARGIMESLGLDPSGALVDGGALSNFKKIREYVPEETDDDTEDTTKGDYRRSNEYLYLREVLDSLDAILNSQGDVSIAKRQDITPKDIAKYSTMRLGKERYKKNGKKMSAREVMKFKKEVGKAVEKYYKAKEAAEKTGEPLNLDRPTSNALMNAGLLTETRRPRKALVPYRGEDEIRNILSGSDVYKGEDLSNITDTDSVAAQLVTMLDNEDLNGRTRGLIANALNEAIASRGKDGGKLTKKMFSLLNNLNMMKGSGKGSSEFVYDPANERNALLEFMDPKAEGIVSPLVNATSALSNAVKLRQLNDKMDERNAGFRGDWRRLAAQAKKAKKKDSQNFKRVASNIYRGEADTMTPEDITMAEANELRDSTAKAKEKIDENAYETELEEDDDENEGEALGERAYEDAIKAIEEGNPSANAALHLYRLLSGQGAGFLGDLGTGDMLKVLSGDDPYSVYPGFTIDQRNDMQFDDMLKNRIKAKTVGWNEARGDISQAVESVLPMFYRYKPEDYEDALEFFRKIGGYAFDVGDAEPQGILDYIEEASGKDMTSLKRRLKGMDKGFTPQLYSSALSALMDEVESTRRSKEVDEGIAARDSERIKRMKDTIKEESEEQLRARKLDKLLSMWKEYVTPAEPPPHPPDTEGEDMVKKTPWFKYMYPTQSRIDPNKIKSMSQFVNVFENLLNDFEREKLGDDEGLKELFRTHLEKGTDEGRAAAAQYSAYLGEQLMHQLLFDNDLLSDSLSRYLSGEKDFKRYEADPDWKEKKAKEEEARQEEIASRTRMNEGTLDLMKILQSFFSKKAAKNIYKMLTSDNLAEKIAAQDKVNDEYRKEYEASRIKKSASEEMKAHYLIRPLKTVPDIPRIPKNEQSVDDAMGWLLRPKKTHKKQPQGGGKIEGIDALMYLRQTS